MNKQELEQALKDNDLSITKNRLQILEILASDHHFHTISEIVNQLQDINVKSVYNNIKSLEEKGVIESISIQGSVKYAIVDSFEHTHPVAHVYKKNHDIGHLDLPQKIYDDLVEIAKQSNKKVKSIKIFIEEE